MKTEEMTMTDDNRSGEWKLFIPEEEMKYDVKKRNDKMAVESIWRKI